jgi:PAS domain-containing protein
MTHDAENTRALTGSSLLEALLQTSSDAIVVSDAEGRIVFWNPGAFRIFGFDAVEAVGQSLDLIIPEKLRARHWQGTVKRLGVRCWAGYDRPSFWLAGDQGWGGFCAWWKSGLKVPAEAST